MFLFAAEAAAQTAPDFLWGTCSGTTGTLKGTDLLPGKVQDAILAASASPDLLPKDPRVPAWFWRPLVLAGSEGAAKARTTRAEVTRGASSVWFELHAEARGPIGSGGCLAAWAKVSAAARVVPLREVPATDSQRTRWADLLIAKRHPRDAITEIRLLAGPEGPREGSRVAVLRVRIPDPDAPNEMLDSDAIVVVDSRGRVRHWLAHPRGLAQRWTPLALGDLDGDGNWDALVARSEYYEGGSTHLFRWSAGRVRNQIMDADGS